MMNRRRDFLKKSAMAGTFLPLMELSRLLPAFDKSSTVEIEIFNTNWGFEGSLELFIKNSKLEGYDGIEVWTPSEKVERTKLTRLLADEGLRLGLLAGNWGKSYEENLESFKNSVRNAVECEPAFINCHSGKDYYTLEQNASFVEFTIQQSSESGIPIYHETHRGRMCFSVPTTFELMGMYDELRLTLDISHWTVVHESFLEDQAEKVAEALRRSRHIHSRVGFQEAPQIPNPSSEFYEQAVKTHFAWWDKIVEYHATNNLVLTMTTEFGPPPYMWTSPVDGNPLEKVWDINVMMLKMWRERYG